MNELLCLNKKRGSKEWRFLTDFIYTQLTALATLGIIVLLQNHYKDFWGIPVITAYVLIVGYVCNGVFWPAIGFLELLHIYTEHTTVKVVFLSGLSWGTTTIQTTIIICNILFFIVMRIVKQKQAGEHIKLQVNNNIYYFLQEVLTCETIEDMIYSILQYHKNIVHINMAFLVVENGQVQEKIYSIETEAIKTAFGMKIDYNAANYAATHNVITGFKQKEYGSEIYRYTPIVKQNICFGVLVEEIIDSHVIWLHNYHYEILIQVIAFLFDSHKTKEEQKRMEIIAEREQLKANLLRSISHDFRTPLTSIIGASSTILELKDDMKSEEIMGLVENIENQAEWLVRMIENILTITKMNANKEGIHKKDELLEEVIADAVQKIHSRKFDCKLEVSIPEEPILIYVEATLIVQVLINMIENAIYHGGNTKNVIIKAKKQRNNIIISIIDDGIGIKEQEIELFLNGDSNYIREQKKNDKGIGIGLNICQSIIRAHGGQITGRNNLSKGANFTILLPLGGSTNE